MITTKNFPGYTSPSVNIAARLQEAAKPNPILVSAAVADYLKDYELTKFRPLKLKGIDEF